MPAAQEMQMQMVDRLAALRTSVDHHTVPMIQSRAARDLRGLRHQMAKQCGMLFLRVRLRRDMFPGNNQQMRWCLRMQIREAQA